MKLVKIMNHIKTQTPASPGQTAAHGAAQIPSRSAVASEIRAAAIAPPPPPALAARLIRGLFLAAIFLIAAPQAAHAQAADTVSIAVTTATDRSSADGIQLNEGDRFTITATLHNPTVGVTVNTGCLDFGGTATAGMDFVGTTSTSSCSSSRYRSGNISNGSPTIGRTFDITNDDATEGPEGDETITLTLVSIDDSLQLGFQEHATITVGTMKSITVTILANDGNAFSIAAGAATATEGTDANATFTVTMVGQALGAGMSRTVDWTATGVTADDVDQTSGTLTFTAPGTQTLTLAITDDAIGEPTETLTVTLSNPSGGAIITGGSGAASTTIADDDSVRTLTVTGPAGGMVMEGAGATFTIALVGTAFSSPTAVTWTVTHDATGGTTDADFPTGGTTGSIMFPTATTFTVATADDDIDESAEGFTVQISVADATADGGTEIGAAASVSIADNDTPGLVVSSSAVSVPEGGMETYTVRLMTQPTTAAGTVTVTVSSGDEMVATVSPASLTFTAANWNTAQTVTVMAHADASINDTATLTHAVMNGMGEYASISSVDVTVTIVAAATDKELQELVLPEVARAVVGQQIAAVVERAGVASSAFGNLPSFNLNGQSSLVGVAAANAQAMANGDGIDAKKLLRDFDFVMPLSAGAANGNSGVGSIAFWGSADYRDFSGEDGDSDWDGGVTSLHFGVDGKVRSDLLAGVMVSYSDSESEYSQVAGGNTQKGDYELDLTSVSPYLNWKLSDDASAWASVSYGSGEVEVKPDGADATTNDVSMQSFAFGGSRRLLQQGKRELSLKADLFVAEAEVEGDAAGVVGGLAEDLTVDANRVRVALAWREPHAGAAKWKPAFDLGLRHDGGDGRTGAGVELGGALRFYDSAVGLTIEGRARALVGHTGDHRGWGVGGLMRVESGADGQGLSLSVTPSYGNADVDLYGDSGSLWNNDLATATAASADDLTARLNAEVGYGLPSKLTPYSAMRVGDSNRDYRLGMKWSAGSHIGLDLSARRIDDGDADNLIALEGRLRF